MNWTAEIRAAFERQGHSPDPDVIEELAQHAAATYRKARAEGADAADAEHQVRADIGAWCRDHALLKRRPRRPPVVEPPGASDVRRLAGLVADVRYAVRVLARQPLYTLVAMLTMALGLGAATTLVSVAVGVLLKPLPWYQADRLVNITEHHEGSSGRFDTILTNASYLAWAESPATLDGLGAYRTERVTAADPGDPERLRICDTTPTLFSLLHAQPILGTLFTPEQDTEKIAAISYGLWQRRFGGSADVLDRTIRFDGEPYRIVAVMPRDFAFPDLDTRAWIPYRIQPVSRPNDNGKTLQMFQAIGRLKPGATPAQAAAEGTARARNGQDLGMVAIAVFGTTSPATITVQPLLEATTADVRPAILVFLVAVGLLLLTATANVASLQLARATTRRREMAIRTALGAGSARLARQLLVENGVLGLAGGALGVLIAILLRQAMPWLLSARFPRLEDISVDGTVTAIAVGLSLLSGLACGLLPMWQARRVDLVPSLAEDGLAPVGGARSRTGRARAAIMAGQVAIACVLLVGAALLGRSFVALLGADRGYDPTNVLTASLNLPDASYTGERRAQRLDALLARIRAQPGVRGAAVTNTLPLAGSEALMGFTMPARDGSSGEVQVQAMIRNVSPGYLAALGIRLIEGRDFTDTDTKGSPAVVLVNRLFADKYLGPHPLGTQLPLHASGAGPDSEIVGLVDAVRQRGATDAPQPEIYICYRQREDGYQASVAYLTVRTATDPDAFVPTLRALVRDLDPSLALDSVMTMDARVRGSLQQPRLYAVLLGGFAGFALVIAGVGLFGVLSYSVAQRSREIGVRTALGATPARIVRLIVRQGLTIAIAGLAAGLTASFWLGRLIGSFLYGVAPDDAVSFGAVGAGLLIVALVACAVPARRAAHIDPQRVLRGG
jgi:putative ABC transport system permease protein